MISGHLVLSRFTMFPHTKELEKALGLQNCPGQKQLILATWHPTVGAAPKGPFFGFGLLMFPQQMCLKLVRVSSSYYPIDVAKQSKACLDLLVFLCVSRDCASS